MADIYLAISETPTVVTLTSAVINSAVASSVTVTNTVTVALDANSLSALENVTVTVGAAITGTVTVGNSVTIGSLPAISGTVTANAGANVATAFYDGIAKWASNQGGDGSLPIYVNVGNPSSIIGGGYNDLFAIIDDSSFRVEVTALPALPAGTNRIGVVTIGAGTVTIGAGTAQIGSVTASISGTVTAMAGTNFSQEIYQGILTYSGNEGGDGTSPLQVNIGSLPAISGTVTANTFALQGTAVTTSNFTSTTASTVLANYNATREVLTIFNEGAGNLHIAPGATCTTIAYQVRLSSGDYYEVPNHQTTITHSAVFATAGTARIVQIS